MDGLLETSKHFISAVKTLTRINSKRKVVIFSEGNNHWRYIRPVVDALLTLSATSDWEVVYITQSRDDCGLEYIGARSETYVIGKKSIRDYVLNNITCDLLLTSTPDIGHFDVKRSPNAKHYAFVQHSLNSLHMAYRENAFREFDTIFCSTFYHEQEVIQLCRFYGLPPKKIARLRYEPVFDLQHYATGLKQKEISVPCILIAPTWGVSSLIETGVVHELIDAILQNDIDVVVRPHPETTKHESPNYRSLVKRAKNTHNLKIDLSIESLDSLANADILLTDCSGISFDFAIGLEKPVIFYDVPPKINNEYYSSISSFVAEISLRKDIGVVISNTNQLQSSIQALLSENFKATLTVADIHSEVASDAISKLLEDL